ncbi:hypothetical protein AWENTII_003163 [Aspergillus wentii]
MSGSSGNGITQQDLEPIERTVVEEINSWMLANPNAEWKQSSRLRLVEQCSDAALRKILQKLTENYSVVYFRTAHSGWVLTDGELVLISPSDSCLIKDDAEDRSYPLSYGSKVCFSKKVSVEVKGDLVYFVWKVKKTNV